MKLRLDFEKAFGNMIRDNEKLADKAAEIAKEAIEEQSKSLFGEYYDGLARHDNRGKALDSLEMDPVTQDGNVIYSKVGTSYKRNPKGYLHARFQEFGAVRKDGVVTFVADPWKVPADVKIASKFRKIALEIIRRRMQ